MDIENKQKEDQRTSRLAFAFFVLSFILFIAAVIHSAIYLGKASDKTKSIRIGFLVIAVILGPIYWPILGIVHLTGGFKN